MCVTARLQQILIIHNPTAGRRRARRVSEVVVRLRARGHGVDLHATQSPGDAETFCRTRDLSGYTRVAIAGGDGTLNEAANGLLSRADSESVPPLAVIPVGTANVLAAEVGLRRDVDSICDYLETGVSTALCPGTINGRVFLIMASVGFDSWVVSTVTGPLKKWLGMGAYIVRACIGLLTYRPPEITVESAGTEIRATTVVVMNGRLYGGPLVLAPQGDLTVTGFQVYLLPRENNWILVRCAIDVLLGRLTDSPHVNVLPTSRLRLSGPDCAVQADGDIVARLPVEIGTASTTIDVLYPR